MASLIVSFFAGVLTILAPCVLTLLPVILGGTMGEKDRIRPLIVTASLGLSVILFSLILKGTTLFIDIPESFWRFVSGGIIFFFGFITLFPYIWTTIAIKLGLYKSDHLLISTAKKNGVGGAVLLGASLGPVFTTCSPTYSLILAVILPASFYVGLLNLFAYALGLSSLLLLISYGGQTITKKIRFLANPQGLMKRSLAVILITIGIIIMTGFDKTIEAHIVNAGYLGPIALEESIQKYFHTTSLLKKYE